MNNDAITCSRCGRANQGETDWIEQHSHGVTVGYICPDDQTGEDHVEASVREVVDGDPIVVKPGDPGYGDAMVQHAQAIMLDVWRDQRRKSAFGIAPAEPDFVAMTDEAIVRLKGTLGVSVAEEPHVRAAILADYPLVIEELGGPNA